MNIALILAGGSGIRLGGDIPKQYLQVDGKPLISFCLHTFEKHSQIDAIQVVAGSEWHALIKGCAGGKLKGFSEPGKTRQLSIYNGLKDILEYAVWEDVVLIHDAARPLVSPKIISDCLDGCLEHEGIMPALPVKDTVYYGAEGRIEALLERSRIVAGQAPEAFRLGRYYEANCQLLPDRILEINGSAEPAVLAGMEVCYIPGDEENFKITTRADMEHFRRILQTVKGDFFA